VDQETKAFYQGAFQEAASKVVAVDEQKFTEALALHERLTKPPGSLGLLEPLGAQLSAISREVPPPIGDPVAVVVFAGDHGVVSRGVTPWPQEVTAQMVANFLAGGAAINAFARQVGARVLVVDVGVANEVPVPSEPLSDSDSTEPLVPGRTGGAPGPTGAVSGPTGAVSGSSESLERLLGSFRPGEKSTQAAGSQGAGVLIRAKVAPGTRDLTQEDAMTQEEAILALDVGARTAGLLVDAGARCLVTGEMGIGNTTSSAALIGALTQTDASQVTGRGTGVSDAVFELKQSLVQGAIERASKNADTSVLGLLSALGGLETAAMAGFIVGAASRRVPVVLDGVISLAAALVAARSVPEALGYMVAGHRSTEPGAQVALRALGLEPLLDLRMRLGEGTGGCMAVSLVQAAARVLQEMATFDGAGVSSKEL
jgi:nicotinate-nucleotide--dimethylbenzimidazole phosphoribosyltransferase